MVKSVDSAKWFGQQPECMNTYANPWNDDSTYNGYC